MVTRVLIILFCSKAYYANSDGTTSAAPAWNDQMCHEIAKTDPVLGDPNYCYTNGKHYTPADRQLCKEAVR